MELKKCPVCGANNSNLAKFCYACGADLRDEKEQEAVQGTQTIDNNAEAVPQKTAPSGGSQYQTPPQQPSAPMSGQVPPAASSYQQPGGYQMPPQGPYGYQVPPQAPYQPYQMPPQGNYYGQPYQPYPGAPYVPLGYKQKSKIAAGVLGILLGTFGVHNFYLGYTGKAVAQLLITLLTCFMGAFVSMIWGVVEGIMILCGGINTDGHNVPLSD